MVDGGPSYCGIIKDNDTGEVFLGLVTEYYQGGGVYRLLPSQQYDYEREVVYNYSAADNGGSAYIGISARERLAGRSSEKARFTPLWGDTLINWWNE